jgi:isoleucyl-tRNA synthetase
VEAEAGHAVALQLEIDEELRRAGLAREIVRAVQDARKNAGLEITDRIALRLSGDSELVAVAADHESYIAGETLATSVAIGDLGRTGVKAGSGSGADLLYGSPGRPVKPSATATIDGRELRISVRAV